MTNRYLLMLLVPLNQRRKIQLLTKVGFYAADLSMLCKFAQP